MSGAFNSFFLLFKNDAGKTKKDVADLEKQIDSLRAKNKQRSAEENQQLKEAEKRHKELMQQKKESERANEKLTDSIASAAAAYVSFNAIKSGIVNAAEFNRNLVVQSRVLGQTTKELRAYAAAVQQAGGGEQELLGFVGQKSAEAASMGQSFSISEYLRKLRGFMAGMDANGKRMVMNEQGLPAGLQSFALMTDAEFEKSIANMEKLTAVTEEGDKAAEEFGKSQDALAQAMRQYWSSVGAVVLPGMTNTTNALTRFVSSLGESKEAASTSFTAMTAGALGLASVAPVISGTVAGAFAALAAQLLAVVAAAKGLFDVFDDAISGSRDSFYTKALKSPAEWLDRQIGGVGKDGMGDLERMNKIRAQGKSGMVGSASVGRMGDTGGDAMQFWMSMGYSRAQAAGIVANEMHESGGRAGARGDGGRAHGLFQWHPDRRAKIMAATGIDVSTASAMDQRRAAAWEMKNERQFSDEKFRSITDPNAAGAYFSRNFERPADAMGEAFKRGQTAMRLASDSSLGAMGGGTSSTSSVKIDKIEVNTQATDANGIANDIGTEMERMLGSAYGNLDDGVAG